MISLRHAPLLLALALAACNGGGGGDGPAAPPANTASLFGTVHVLGSTTRVAGVTVSVPHATTTTDANGAFAFTGLPPGRTTVGLARAGYRATTATLDLVAGDNTVSIALELINCPQIGGAWQASWANACGASGRGALTVQQTGCDISLTAPIATISPASSPRAATGRGSASSSPPPAPAARRSAASSRRRAGATTGCPSPTARSAAATAR